MSRRLLIAIIAGIIVAIVATGVAAVTTDNLQSGSLEGGNVTQGRHLTLDLNENLSLKENA